MDAVDVDEHQSYGLMKYLFIRSEGGRKQLRTASHSRTPGPHGVASRCTLNVISFATAKLVEKTTIKNKLNKKGSWCEIYAIILMNI
jgi:hypothetical protein